MRLRSYRDVDRKQVVKLVLSCQNDGSRPEITLEDQPDLLRIPQEYQEKGGGFWVMEHRGRIVGCIGLMLFPGKLGVLKKFFVDPSYRGAPYHLGQRLFRRLLGFARKRQLVSLFLDTPKDTRRAHDFYQKAGFSQVSRQEVPIRYHLPCPDSDFFRLDLSSPPKP